MDKLRNIEKWKIFTILGVLVVVVFILIEIENMYISRKWDDSLGELLVGTTLEVKDEDEHNLTEEIESADQIKVVELDLKHVGILKNKYVARVDVETETGIIKDVCVDVVVPFFFVKKSVKWYYTCDDDGKSEISFSTEKIPSIRVKDVMDSLGASEPYDIMAVDTTGISNNYDAIEYCAIYKENDGVPKVSWTRLEYNYNSKEWEWCEAVDKSVEGVIGLAYANLYDFGFSAQNEVCPLDEIVNVSAFWAGILE